MQTIPHLPYDIPVDALPTLITLALWEMPITQHRLLNFLNTLSNEVNAKMNGNTVGIKSVLSQLTTLGCINFVQGSSYQISVEVKHAVLLYFYETKKITLWIDALQGFLNKNSEYVVWAKPSSLFCQREMLFAALKGDLAKLGLWRSHFFTFQNSFTDLLAQKLFTTPAGALLFSSLLPKVQAILLFDLFSAASWMLKECTTAYQYAKTQVETLFKNDLMLIDTLCTQAILRGESTLIQQSLIEYMGQESNPLAIIKLLQGDFASSAQIFNSIHSNNRRIAKKQKLFIPDATGVFYTIAQLANKTALHLKLAKTQCDEGYKLRHAQFYSAISPLIEHLIQGTPLTAQLHTTSQQNLDNLFIQLAHFWQGITPTESDRHNLYLLFAQSGQSGYQWVAAEIDQLRHHQFNEACELGDWHLQHYLQPLYRMLQTEAPWKRALLALSQLNVAHKTELETRIAWFLECGMNYIHLEPREQKRSVKGVWNKGRPISLKRLCFEQEIVAGMSAQDKKMAQCIRKSFNNSYSSDYELDGEKALPFLIGHPAVYWLDAPDVQIDIIKGEPALVMTQQGEAIKLQLVPAINTNQNVVWRKQTLTRLEVYPSTPEIKQIAAIISRELLIPTHAKAELVKVIAAIAPHLAIHSDLPELAQHIDNIAADSIIYAHLLPLKEGLRIQFLVRPLPEGSWFAPGKGHANVVGEYQGKAIQASRNLAAEQTQLNNILENCLVLNQHPQIEQVNQEWELDHPEACLELLTALNTFKSEYPNQLALVWPEGERFRIQGSYSLQQFRLSIKKQGEWFVAGGEIQLDNGKVVALRELLKMVNSAPGRFLALDEHNFLALTDSFKKRLQELHALSESDSKEGVRINPLATSLLVELSNEVAKVSSDAAWKAQVKKLETLINYVPTLPSTLQAELRDYQLEGYQWLARLAYWGVGACLADDMGLGKTVQALALLLERAPNGPALVVAPVSVTMNWQSEAIRFAPTLRVRLYQQNRSLEQLGAFDLVLASYGMLQQDADVFAQHNWHTVVLDEAQVIKNSATKRSQAAMRLQADFRLIASGTPVENHLGELWNLFRFINPGLLGSKERFTQRFANPIERGDKLARAHLKRLIQPFLLRRTKTQVLSELPARTEITLQVELSSQERHMYEALRQEAVTKLARMNSQKGQAIQVLAEITKLRRFCCHPQLVINNAKLTTANISSKLAVFIDIVEELLDNHHKVLVFSQFVDHLAIVRTWLEEKALSYQYLDGSVAPIERKKRVDAFQAGQGELFLISLKAGGTGLNLTAADYVIHLDPWWNPAVEDQASDRAHRMGQLRPVTVYRLVTKQTIEEQIIALHAQKRDIAESLLEGGDVSGKLDTASLLRLLKEEN